MQDASCPKNCPSCFSLVRGSTQKTHGSLDSGGELQKVLGLDGLDMKGRNHETC